MKIILAPDKYKNSLTGIEFCDIVEHAVKQVIPSSEIIRLPLADGGDGTIDVIKYYLDGEQTYATVNNPYFQPILASYLFSKTTKTAFIEMAEASGLKLLETNKLNCKRATTLGTGELIMDAIKNGAKQIILGIGGSATNDCGIGMAYALGYSFYNENYETVLPIGKNLSAIKHIENTNVYPELKNIRIKVAMDVTNPLHGENGAAYVYAKQKGASLDDIKMLDKGLKDFSKVLDNHFNIKSNTIKGGGAAGGLGVGAIAFLNAAPISGIDLIKELADFEIKIKDADWIITGEGKLDSQTLSGKVIDGIMISAIKNNIPIAAFCGSVDLNKVKLKHLGITYVKSIMNKAKNFEDAISNTKKYLNDISLEFANYIK